SREQLLRAVKLNPQRLNYRLALAKDYVNEVKADIFLLSTPGQSETITAERKAKLQTNVQQALKEGQAATAIAPNSVMAWETLGAIYRDIRLIAVGSLEPAIRYLTKASELEPTNPVLLAELGKLYLANGQTKEAADAFEQAAEFKGDYWEAQVGLAQTYDSLGQTDKALVILEDLISRVQTPEIIYESGRLYYNQGKIDKAIERFKEAIALRPDYANAVYSLGAAYKKQGDKIRALEQFQKVLELNPGNEAVGKMVEELKNEISNF
ncbi:MAG: tetratricopeptide repeat protein, partial [Patescibacteria group bacterium]